MIGERGWGLSQEEFVVTTRDLIGELRYHGETDPWCKAAADKIEWFGSSLISLLTLAEAKPSPLTNEQVAMICRHVLDN